MIKKITQKEFTNEMISWSGENISFNSISLNRISINGVDDIESLFHTASVYNSVKTWRIKEDLKVEIKSSYLLLNDSRLDLKGKCFKYNDDILGLLNDNYLIIYYKNK